MYTKMAEIYDRLMQDAPYDEWIKFSKKFINQTEEPMTILDVGCGTGEVALRFAQQGFRVHAFDLSEQMISRAKSKNQFNVHFFQDDATTFNLQQTFNLIVSYCDVLNYIVDREDLVSVFSRVYNHLNDNGVFIFDVHSMSYVSWLSNEKIFSEVYDDLAYIWMCEEQGFGEVHHDLTFFIEEQRGMFKRFDEYHVQKTYPVDQYLTMLKTTGFSNVNIYYDFLEQTHDENGDRVFFVCKK